MNIRIITYPFFYLFLALILFILSLFSSCGTQHMNHQARANIHLPVQPVEETVCLQAKVHQSHLSVLYFKPS